MSRFKKCAMNLLPLRICVFCMTAVLPWLSYAETETIDGFRWCYRSVEDGVEITSPIEVGEEEDSSWWDGRSLTVPERLGGNPVVSIGDNAFAGGSFAAISLPNTVTKIGGRAFANCSSLVSVDLSDRLTYIGWGAFSHTGISSIDIPPGVTDILFDTFASCASLSSVTFHDDIKSIQSGAFRGCGLRSVMLPKNLECLAQDAFSDDYIEDVTVFSKLRTLDFSAFRHSQVGRITIPDSDVSICRTGTGDDWTMISSVTLPWSKVQALLDALTIKCDYDDGTSSTFWYGPQTLEISDTVEEIPDGMFIGNGGSTPELVENTLFPRVELAHAA